MKIDILDMLVGRIMDIRLGVYDVGYKPVGGIMRRRLSHIGTVIQVIGRNKMNNGDKIMVNWPTGKSGPYYIGEQYYDGSIEIINNNGPDIIVPGEWCEPIEPEIEEGRLVVGKHGSQVIYGRYRRPDCNDPMRHKILNRGIEIRCSNVRPIHRRWEELKDTEQSDFGTIIIGSTNKTIDFYDVEHIYKEAYELITEEEHPKEE